MRAVVLERARCLSLMEIASPAPPKAGEALVRVRRVGICGSDLHAYKGEHPFIRYPRVPGHELGVEVVSVGANDHGIREGTLCAVEPYLHCGECAACRRGRPNCCYNIQFLGVHTDGGLQEFMVLPGTKLHKSEQLSVDQLALVEMLSIGAHAVRRAQVGEGDTVLVLGAGPIGLSIAAFARLLTRDVVVTDLNERRRDFCRRHLEVKACLDGQGDIAAQVRSEFGGDLPTVVFDATGSPKSMMQAVQYLVNGGRLALVSLVSSDLTFHDPQLHRLELTLYCCRNSVGADFEWAIAALEAGQIDVNPWITHRTTTDQIVTEFVKWLDPDQGVVKAVVELK